MVAHNFADMTVLSSISRTRRSFLKGGCSRCSTLDGTICCSNRRNVNEAMSHDGSFDHSVLGQELAEG